jgi:ATP-dependent DNA ligase
METYQDKNSPLYEGLPFMKIRGETITYPCVAELKFDGEFQYVITKDNKVYLVNKREHGRIRVGMTCTNVKLPDNSVFIGELFYGAGKDFYEFARHKLTDDLNLALFGVLRLNGEDVWKTWKYYEGRKYLESLPQEAFSAHTTIVPKFVLQSEEDFNKAFSKVTSNSFEGLVIKGLLSSYIDGETKEWVKRKFEDDSDLAICGFQTGTKRAKNLSLLLGHSINGQIVPFVHCGGGLTNEQKDAFLKTLTPHVKGKIKDDYIVTPKFVVRVKHNGVIRNPDGSPNSLRHPRFITVREDKSINEVDEIK